MLQTEIKNNVAILSIDRPHVRNAMTLELARNLEKTFNALDKDPNVNAIILCGKEHGFGAGSDLKELSQCDLDGIADIEKEKARIARSINYMNTPVIAAVHGFALGGMLSYAISCDVIFTEANAKWHFPETALGWTPGWAVRALVSRVGPVAARHLSWGVEPIDGTEAVRLGLADFIAEKSALDSAVAYAEKLAQMPPEAVAATKQLCAPVAGQDGETLDVMANMAFKECCKHETAMASYARFGIKL